MSSLSPDQPTPEHEPGELHSWKEIAAFFAVNVRTAQNWEQERGLPVQRLPGSKGRVWARVSDLQSWRANVPQKASAAAPEAPSRRGADWMWGTAIAGVVVFAAVVAWVSGGAKTAAATPSSIRVEGHVLVVLDEHGREAWRRRFDREPNLKSQHNERGSYFTDLDGDGRPELLFPLKPQQGEDRQEILYCISSDGEELWHYAPGRVVSKRKQTFRPIYRLRDFQPVPVAGTPRRRVVVTASEIVDEPSQVTLLDFDGRPLREYWHSGHLYRAAVGDMDGDGSAEIYLGGIANGYDAAVIVALDARDFGGASEEENKDYQLLGLGPAKELARIVLPRTRANALLQKNNMVSDVVLSGNELLVTTDEPFEPGMVGAVAWTFGPRLRLKAVQVGDFTYAAYKLLHRRGMIPWDLLPGEVDSYGRIQYVTRWRR